MAEPTGAAFGIYPSSGRRPERLNQSRGVNAPLQLLRGWAAGTLGLPGDIEGLVRMLPGIQNETPVLPTSDFYREWLPGYDERPAARAMSGLGALTGGMGATRVAREGLGAVKRATDVNAIRDYVRAAQGMAGLPGAAVVKPKGGNWISGAGSPEEAVRGLRNNRVEDEAYLRAMRSPEFREPYNAWLGKKIDEDPGYRAVPGIQAFNQFAKESGLPPLRVEGPEAALNTWLDQKLTKYIRNEMGTPEDPLRAQVEAFPAKRAELLAVKDAQLAKARADMERARAQRGFTPEMMTESQARIRDLERERALIEPLTGLHFAPENVFLPADTAFQRQAAGYPRHGMAKSQLATDWEVLADAPISTERAGELRRSGELVRENPWLAKVPPDTSVHSMIPGDTVRNQNLGFGHLVDELRNAMNPASGLPRELLLSPEQLGKMNVPAAAAHVDRVNAWRAAQKAEADLARAGNAATVEYKAYDVVPGTELPNERGLRWVEIRTPEESNALPEGYSLSTITNENLPPGHMGRNSYAVVDPQGRMLEDVGLDYTEAGAMDKFKRSYHGRAVEDALKYEGETMGHCVGGYCPDVMEGRSRIFSLRDAKGQPHVTVEVKPPTNQESVFLGDPRLRGNFSAEEMQLMERVYGDITQMPEELASRVRKLIGADVPEIIQIKGKANRAPKDEYLPYVQDFVRSGQWGRVGDIQNTGMRPTREVFNFNELQMLKKLGEEHIPDALTGGDIQRLHNMIVPEGQRLKYDARGNVVGSESQNYARGGAVRATAGPAQYDPERIAALAEQLTMEA